MKNVPMKKCVVAAILILFLLINTNSSLAHAPSEHKKTVEWNISFSSPLLKQNGEYLDVELNEANGAMANEGCPMMPMVSHTFEFPFGTRLLSIEVTPSDVQTMTIEKRVTPVPSKQKIGNQIVPVEGNINPAVYDSAEPYPASWSTITTGAGLNTKSEHVLFVTIHMTPVHVLPKKQQLQYLSHLTVRITVEESTLSPLQPSSDIPLVILAPSDYSPLLQPLVDHKNTSGVPTTLVSIEDIYSTSSGRDNAEKIKYFIKHALDDWNTQYVLLIGDIKKLPTRVTYASWWEDNLLSDQYYADIYNAAYEFCSWDANNNSKFGEIDHNNNDRDGVDLYADVHVGRLACRDTTEVATVVNKIIAYEEETFNQLWFKRIVLAGGDTFPGAPAFVYEGEITNEKVAQNLPGFDTTFLWTSKRTLHAFTFNRAINQGAGFVSYAGHGFEHGWGTYRPNAINNNALIWYFTPYVNGLRNGNKLPIIFFDACLTTKLDFNFTDLQHYFPHIVHLLTRIFKLSEDPSVFYECFAWSFLIKDDGGGIATIGSTRTAYTWVDADGVYGGAGYLDVHFFKAYQEGVHLGQMLTSAQNDYINNVGKDFFTLEEFMLLGDPSLMVGGYE